MYLLQKAEFLCSVAHSHGLPDDARAEVAVAGRSNSGKSSAINALARRNRLAHVSRTPGRTQLLNFFTVSAGNYLVDLPGYGYARVPRALKEQWGSLVSGYLENREPLVGLLLVMDCRRQLTVLDEQMLEWFMPRGKPVHILLTKADKLSRQSAAKALNTVRLQLATCPGRFSVQLFSSLDKRGLDEAEVALATMFKSLPSL